MAEVNDSAFDPGASIGDSNQHACAGSNIADPHSGTEGQGAMRGGERIRVKL